MENVIIIVIVAVLAVIGVVYTVKHFKRQGGCCGSSDYRPKKKKLANVRYKKVFRVEGMHCANCKNRVEELVNDLRGVAGSVDLKKGLLTVSYAEDVADEQIKSRIEKNGYTVTGIEKI